MAHWTETFFTGYWSMMQRAPIMTEVAAEEARVLSRILRLRKGSRVADVPCGDGRITVELARRGCRVVGVDGCRPSIRRARRRLRSAGLSAEFHVGDMRSLTLAQEFDALINWWGSFGYFDEETNLSVLRGFAATVVPGGRVLIDQANRERVLRQFMEKIVHDAHGVRVIARNRWDPETERINGTWTFVRGRERVRRRSSIRLYTPKQMERLMEEAGLELEVICDGKTGLPFNRGSRRMTAVGRRPR